ncbi:MAG: U32 family peptidase C-terminal domain-containing protein [bacterium]
MKAPEILAPAGTFEKLKFSLAYGADAVYAAGEAYGLRYSAGNFGKTELKAAVEYTHALNKKIYITVNIFPRNKDIGPIKDYLAYLNSLKVDGMIIADLGVFNIAAKTAPDIPKHISVQANNVNYETVSAWRDMGAKRIILARELSFDEIKEIRQQVPDMELELFVHGAICIALSGRCLLSNYLKGRDANQGDCAQSCRWSYTLMEEKRRGMYLPIEEDGRGTYIMNSKDLCVIDRVQDFVEIGIDSFKIEGRMKSAHYAAVTTAVYKKAITEYLQNPKTYKYNDALYKELEKVSHREYTRGFYFPDGTLNQNFKTSYYTSTFTLAAYALEEGKGIIKTMAKNTFRTGDAVEVLLPNGNFFPAQVEAVYNSEMLEEVYTKHDSVYFVKLSDKSVVPAFSIIRTPNKEA